MKKIFILTIVLITTLLAYNSFGNEKENLVQFKFYDSNAKEVYLAGNFNNWSKTSDKMEKEGNWFIITVPIKKDIQYKFVADGNWYFDPFNTEVISGDLNSSLKLPLERTTNIDSNIKLYESEHFEYYTQKIDRTKELESLYKSLTKNILAFRKLEENQQKIKYFGVKYRISNYSNIFSGPFARGMEIYDSWDCASSHEIIHTLVYIKNIAFNEGIAQCFQKEGNANMKEQNVNLFAKNYIKYKGNSDLESILTKNITGNGEAYKIVASFIYYNILVINDSEKFNNFLNSLNFEENISDIQNKYKKETGKNLTEEIENWEKWLLTIDKDSDIYVKAYEI